jgi:formylglycine-generating enzyme required for sulfatase activity
MRDEPLSKLEIQIGSPKALVRRIDQRIDLVDRLLDEADAARTIELRSSFTNSLGMKMIWCPPGEFLMGSPEDQEGRREIENQVQVRISKGFWMSNTPVTLEQWHALMRNNHPSYVNSSHHLPVGLVSWNDARDFCAKLNRTEPGTAGYHYALPTEAQWEYACRAGTKSVFSFGDTLTSMQANFNGNYPYGTTLKGPYLEKTSVVASYPPNTWGLYDMHGNVWEWCADWKEDKLYGGTDPRGPTMRVGRVLRGGSWDGSAAGCRSADRSSNAPSNRHSNVGFRPAIVPSNQ